MILFELVAERAREIREFILLPWPVKKNRARQFWDKYGRLYILLFILATVIAVINVYIETQTGITLVNSRRQLGGDDTKPPTQNISSNNSSSSSEPETSQPPAVEITDKLNIKPSTTTKPETNTTETNANNTISSSGKKTESKNQSSKNTINITTQVSTTLPTSNTTKSSKNKVNEIRERRKTKQTERSNKSSVKESFTSLGNNLTAGISGGTGRALSVLGTFFSAILGLLLFCCAPVVIFYMWMKKLIMPLFPVSNQ